MANRSTAARVRDLEQRYLAFRADFAALRLRLTLQLGEDPLETKQNPNWRDQPRAPAGTPDGGQWVAAGGGSGGAGGEPASGHTHPRAPSAHPVWRAVGWSARKLREVEARLSAWVEENAPGALEAAAQVPDAFAQVLFALGGEEGIAAYDEFTVMLAEGGAEAEARYRAFVADQIARGRLTQEQAEDVTYLLGAGAAAGAVFPVGSLGRTARRIEHIVDPAAELARRNREILLPSDPRFHFPMTRPTGARGGGNLTGEDLEDLDVRNAPNRGEQSGLERQGQSARILDRAGFRIHQNPDLMDAEMEVAGLRPGKKPDFLIENRVFDNYAPLTDDLRNITYRQQSFWGSGTPYRCQPRRNDPNACRIGTPPEE